MRCITEEDKDAIDSWYEEAETITIDTLPDFLRKLSRDYDHDYGTICHAITASAIAAARAMDATPQGGITGFQAGAVMWMFIEKWAHKKAPMRLIEYRNMLYPQYEDEFDKVISESAWKMLQEEATRLLDRPSKESAPRVRAHWQSIVDGNIPFGFKVKPED